MGQIVPMIAAKKYTRPAPEGSNEYQQKIYNKWKFLINKEDVEVYRLSDREVGVLASILEDTENIIKNSDVNFMQELLEGKMYRDIHVEGILFTHDEIEMKICQILLPFMRANGMKIYYKLANKKDVYALTRELAIYLYTHKHSLMKAHYKQNMDKIDKNLHKLIINSPYPRSVPCGTMEFLNAGKLF